MLKYLVIFALVFVQNGSPRPTPNAAGFGKPQSIPKTSQSAAENQNQQAQIAVAIEPSLSEQADGKPQTNKGTAPDDPDKPWSLSDKIAVGACIAGFSQFVALLVTICIMIRNGRRQLRAHVFPNDISIVDGSLLDPPEMHKADIPAISMLIKNSGQTPAYDVVSWLKIEVIPVAEEGSLSVPALAKKHSTAVGTGCTFNKALWFDRPITADEKEGILGGTLGIYAHGRIEYRDVFKIRHFSNFRLVYTGKVFPPIKGAVMGFCEHGNSAN
jgi:hypothetical protein